MPRDFGIGIDPVRISGANCFRNKSIGETYLLTFRPPGSENLLDSSSVMLVGLGSAISFIALSHCFTEEVPGARLSPLLTPSVQEERDLDSRMVCIDCCERVRDATNI